MFLFWHGSPTFNQTHGQKEDSLEGQMLQRGLLKGFKWSLCQLVQHQGEVPGGDAPLTLGSVSVEAIQETNEILTLLIFMGEFPSLSAKTDL